MTKTSLSEADEQEIVERYVKGLSTWKLAERFGVSDAAIRRSLERSGQPRRPERTVRVNDIPDTEIIRLRDDEGLTWREIAARLDMRLTTVQTRYQRAMRRVARS